MKSITKLLAAAVLAACVLTPSLSQAAVIYRETFSSTTNEAPSSNVDWFSLSGSTANQTTNWRLSNANGKPTDLSNVNAGSSGQTVQGFLFDSLTSNGQPTLVYTTEYLIDRTQYDLTSFSWYLGNGNTTDPARLAIRIGSDWFATNTTFLSDLAVANAGEFSTKAGLETFNWTTAASAWRDLTVIPGTSLAVAGTARTNPLPTGNIDAFGVFFDTRNANQRIDTFEINAIPEPSSVALIGLALAAGLFLRRRQAVK